MKRSDQQKKLYIREKRRGIGFETVAGMGGAILETLLFAKNPDSDTYGIWS